MRIKLRLLLKFLGNTVNERQPPSAFPYGKSISSSQTGHVRHYCGPPPGHVNYFPNKIGNREVVGFGMNGKPEYIDSVTFPYPAIRFREINPDYKALKEKEKGSWRLLTVNEKKCLYRVSFCKTMAEIQAPTGEWKKIGGSTLLTVSGAIWFYLFIAFMTKDKLPKTFEKQSQQAQLQRMLDLQIDPIDGLSSKWDYETGNWKGKPPKKIQKKDKKKDDDDD